MKIRYIEKTPTATEINTLTESVDWGTRENSIVEEALKYKKLNPDIRTYLGASKGKESFYEKFGFISRPNEDLGAGMILYDD